MIETQICDSCETSARVRCDRCGCIPHKGCGQTVDTAVEHALRIGYRRAPGARLSDPMLWLCPDCQPLKS